MGFEVVGRAADDVARMGRMSIVEAGADTASATASYALGQNGNDAFKIWPYRVVENTAMETGPEMGARFIRFENGEVGYGQIRMVRQAVEEGKSGFLGIGKRGPKYEPVPQFVKHPTPTPPPPPSASEQVKAKLKMLQGRADNLVESAKKLGKTQHAQMQSATNAQNKAKEYLGHARDFIKSGDDDSAIDALYKVVTHSQMGDEYANMAKVVAGERSLLMKQVAEFRSGLESLGMQTELKSVRIEAANSLNQVKKEMTGLGSDAGGLRDQIGKMDEELANVTAENSAMDEMIANGEVDSLFGDPLAARAKSASAEDSVKALFAELKASIQTEQVAEEAAGSAIGATQASDTAATTVKSMEF